MYERWQDMITLANTAALAPTSIEAEQVKRLKYVGIAHAMLGQTAQTDAFKKELQTLLDHNISERDKAGKTATTKAEAEQEKDTKKKEADKKKAVTKATADARRSWDKKVHDCEQAIAALTGYTHLKNGEYEKALELLRKAGSVDRMTIAKCQQASGDTDGAIKAAADHVKSHAQEVQPLALQVEILHAAGKTKDAQTAFKELQAISGSIDMQSPVFARITTIAADLGCDGQWKQELELRDDIGNRPDLDTLGPFRWQPSAAPKFILRDHRNRKFSSIKEFNGKPTIVVFYLGHGCLACAEQLQKVIDNYDKFVAAGFDILAISSDDNENLKQSIKHFDGELPFTIVNDPKLEIFKEYRVHDDFEEQPLHGTFIIDADGLVRWQDISYEPFMDTDFLLKEAARLLDVK
jgi:peroxiredoxin